MFEKVLIATDLSPASDALISCVGELKNLGLQEVILVHVIYVANTPGLDVLLSQDAEPILELQKSVIEKQGIRVITEMPVGIPSYTLSDIAEKYDVAAIIIGSHGKGILKKAALGSVSTELLQKTSRAVLLVRVELIGEGEKCGMVCHRLFDHILFCTDFSSVAENAFAYLKKVVENTKCAVTILHVQDRISIEPHLANRLEEFNNIDKDRLEKMKKQLEELGSSQVEIDLPYGSPKEIILDKIGNGHYSLAIMGSQGKGFVKEAFLGSVSNNVVRLGNIPVLLIPALR